ncbi:MAG TPA: hypothetical protein VG164_06455, partial [Trebonia sp.]|nr:hypothetical protein [Trebonia sp.]
MLASAAGGVVRAAPAGGGPVTGQPGDPTVLLSSAGAEILARVAASRSGPGGAAGGPRSELALAAELRREYPPDLAAAAMAQYELRVAAGAKFSRAMD